MTDPLTVRVDDVGIHLLRAGTSERRFPWADRRWTLDLRDTRVPRPAQSGVSGLPEHHRLGRPRITDLTAESAAMDRTLLDLPEDPGADPVLLTNPAAPGEISLHFGPLHVHSARIDDEQARELVRGAVARKLTVRRATGLALLPHGGSAYCLVTEITAIPADETPEVEP